MSCNPLEIINANLDTGATATIVTVLTLLDHQGVYNICYTIGWSGARGTERLLVQVGPTGQSPVPITYPVLNKQGQPVTIGTLRQARRLCLKFVNPNTSPQVIPAHFVLGNTQCPQIIVTPSVVTASPPVLALTP